MYKKFDSHIHFNMEAVNIANDFITQVKFLDGFILILNNEEEKKVFENSFLDKFIQLFPLSVLALNYELANTIFLNKLNAKGIGYGLKLHPRLSNITKDKFRDIANLIEGIDFKFIIIDCFYYGSNLETHTNLELSIFIAKYFKDQKILLAHSGGHKVLEYMLYTRELKNIYYDLSLTSNYLKNTSVEKDMINFIKYNYSRIFFGSDYPDFSVKSSLDSYLCLTNKAALDNIKVKKILYENIILFLN